MMFFRAGSDSGEAVLDDAMLPAYDLAGALDLFLAMVNGLRHVHKHTELHRALCLANLRVRHDGKIEFRNDAMVPLAYSSPEQTGRMNRHVDYRSDYYSLGIVMYELLTGHLPFESDSVMELVHAHIAKKPQPVNRLNPVIPEVLSNIVLKLLAKNAEDRYQSLDGIRIDLEQCRKAIDETGVIESFPLAQHDVCDRLQISQKLYGREREYNRLMNAFRNVTKGHAELLLISGYAGIGKSSLVNEMHKPVVAYGGYFISGKFDQFRRSIPYSAINQALRELMRQILTESEARIAQWRSKLLKALGPNGQLIIDAIPELEFVIGKQPALPALGATRNSFHYVMQNFVSVFTHSDYPIVLFLDDLQWADASSLKLISMLMKNLEDPSLLPIGAYRSNEVDVSHPLSVIFDQIKKDVPVKTIEVHPLAEENIVELLADTLRREPAEVKPLATLIFHKTLGNPFFINQFVKNLHAEGMLTFDDGQWQWDLHQIRTFDMTDNVIDLLTREMGRLPQNTQRLLTIAACIGSRFDLQTLSIVSEKPEHEIRELLQEAIQTGLIQPSENKVAASTIVSYSYQFLHDRVQQAAYEGTPRSETNAIHLQIGRLLMSSLSKAEKEEVIFDIVDHLNQGRALLASQDEKDELASLNLVAAKRARQSAAMDVHRDCIQIAHDLGAVEDWKTKQAFMHELYMELINAAFARADYREMERLCQLVCDNSTTSFEIIAAKDYLIRCYGAIYKPRELMETGIEMMQIAGIKVPKNINEGHIRLARWRLALAMRGRDPLSLASLPPATNQQYLLQVHATMAFLGYGFTYLANSPVVLWVALEIVRRSIRYGSSPLSAYAYAVWGRTLAGKYGHVEDGYKFGKVSSLLGGDKPLLGAVGIFHGIIRHRREHLRLSLEPLMDTYVKAMETGDRPGAMVALSFADAIRFQAGTNVRDGLVTIRKDIDIYRKMDYAALLGVMIPWALLYARFVGESIIDITQGRTQEDYVVARRAAADPWGVFYVRAIQSIGECYFGEYAEARAHAAEALSLPGFDFGTPSSGFLLWVHALAEIALCDSKSRSAIALTLTNVNASQKRFQVWAEHAPMNYLHKWQLVEAERYRLAGKTRKAEHFYEEAIKGARSYGFLSDEALSHELAGRFFLQQGKEINARMHLEQAHARYEEWGASGKAAQMEMLYPALLVRVSDRKRLNRHDVSDARERQVDVQTLVRASQTLSGEIQLDKLLSKLMYLLIENAGAQKGALLMMEHGRLFVSAEINGDTVAVQEGLALEKSRGVSLAIVNYVKRTGERVVLGDAANDSQFNSDPYIEREQPKSILCLPLHKQGQLVGILYLENNLAIDAFTSDHAALLQMLSTQIAISLENAGLYNDLEQKIEARTQALSQKNAELRETLASLRRTQKQLVESAKLASLGQLVAGVAHEINTPVGVGVTGASTLAEETARLKALFQTGEMKRSDLDAYVGTAASISKLLLSNMERAATLIQSFKDVAVDQTSEERRVFRLKAYIEEVLSNLSPMLRRTEHRINVNCDDSIEVDSYPGALSQIITNFVMNALLHAFPDDTQGEMLIVVRSVYAKGQKTNLIELRFSDNGKGIPHENLAKIFDPFFTTTRGQGGSGLGLNIIHNLVNGPLQGQINVESQPGVGTTFIVRFPSSPDLPEGMARIDETELPHHESR
ncbi:MAG: AAA family ATPase [Oxalicibacterium faecigallinarum]|uniref:trifunctional serine/threonine-protein kinase/ATP-binding protein/sensor histidine kinase n=1 Tax=Oxalicibacterium faecigallinarum TaxID=573741 RepID=UPI00280722D2|nr:AAA family ATPase [Oxalicibacterium faecigallinarum]MDQ7969877.1 AAA family ATPase [Oxalicibacterium faecigallinarum]